MREIELIHKSFHVIRRYDFVSVQSCRRRSGVYEGDDVTQSLNIKGIVLYSIVSMNDFLSYGPGAVCAFDDGSKSHKSS